MTLRMSIMTISKVINVSFMLPNTYSSSPKYYNLLVRYKSSTQEIATYNNRKHIDDSH